MFFAVPGAGGDQSSVLGHADSYAGVNDRLIENAFAVLIEALTALRLTNRLATSLSELACYR